MGGRECVDIWDALNSVFVHYDGDTHIGSIEWVSFCITKQLFDAAYEYRIGCIICSRVSSKVRIREWFLKTHLSADTKSYDRHLNKMIYETQTHIAFCDGCQMDMQYDEMIFMCDECNDAYCCCCIAKRVAENNELHQLLNEQDVLGTELNTDCIFEIVGFVKGLVLKFDFGAKNESISC